MSEAATLTAVAPLADPTVGEPPAHPRDPEPKAPARRPKARLEIPGYDLAAALRLERELGIGHVLAQVLVRRGYREPEASREFLDADVRHDVEEFAGIEQIVALIGGHIAAGGRIVVHGDYDVDGVCATSILVRALRALGADAGWFVPSRLEEGYGLSLSTVRRLSERGTALIVTVDCGISATEEVAAARGAGIDVVVTDHHAPPEDRLPDCPVLHPLVCGYPCADLCGSAVSFKLAQALGAPTTEDDLELVALATVADLMPLVGENRTLVRDGIKAMSNTARPGLRALMSVARADPSDLSAQDLGFRLAPRINAAGRLRRADAAIELLMTEKRTRAEEIAAELDSLNAERRAVEQRTLWEAEAQVEELGERSAFVLAARGWHPGVIGIVASRLVERYHRPAILIAIDEEGIGHGSGRGIPGFDLLGALHCAADHLERYGGHRAAAGLTIREERVADLREALEAYAEATLTPELLEPTEAIDAVVSGRDLGLDCASELERLEPCGMANPTPRLLVPGARFGQVRAIGDGRHAQFSVASGGAIARAVAFGCDGKLDVAADEPVDATFRLERNTWNGTVEPRLVLRQARCCEPPPIKIVGEDEDYLSAFLAELQRDVQAPSRTAVDGEPRRTVLDRRDESPLAVLANACAAGGPVLAVCADVHRRLGGLRRRCGGFSLVGFHALERGLPQVPEYDHLVVLDPPASRDLDRLLREGEGFTYLNWRGAELRFAEQMHELEYRLRESLVTLYRSLRLRERAAGGELERLLRGEGPHGRPARIAARLVRVLAELELVSLDRALPALSVASATPTSLERSATYRACVQRYEDGLQYLNREKAAQSV